MQSMPSYQTHKTIFDYITSQLKQIYEALEAANIAFLLMEHLYQSSKIDISLQKDIQNFDENILKDSLHRLLKHEPIQYILGRAYFYFDYFLVNRHTLIPRSETEELVHLIIAENKLRKGLKIIDIGTGTACIPITLFHHLLQANLYAIDINSHTLEVAKQNAANLQASIQFLQADILQIDSPKYKDLISNFEQKFDIMVSNPPYIRELEKLEIKENVLAYEPAEALFVPNENPLLFYQAIADFALKHLDTKGKLYFEINEYLGEETKIMLENRGFRDIKIYKDLHNKDRICVCGL